MLWTLLKVFVQRDLLFIWIPVSKHVHIYIHIYIVMYNYTWGPPLRDMAASWTRTPPCCSLLASGGLEQPAPTRHAGCCISLRVQVPNNYILTQNPYYKY